MTRPTPHRLNPKLDLVLERVVDVPRELVWAAWTTPEYVKKWFTPAPWQTVECEIDLRPGGVFRTVMRSPEGRDTPNVGCYLEIVERERLVWTTALAPGYRPIVGPVTTSCDDLAFTAIILFEPHGKGTKYQAIAVHGDEAVCKKHETLGFHEGWGATLDQLVALAKTL
jgi:uncharacterized protein YndB with AHSA1/START domain